MIDQFKNFSIKEVNSFHKFVNSPYFNSNKQLITLVNYLKSVYPEIKEEHISRNVIMKKVYQSGKFDDPKYRKLISDFTNIFEEFLTYSELGKETIRNKTKLLNVLRRRGLNKRFNINLKEVEAFQKKQFSKDNTYYENAIEIETDYFYFNYNKFSNEFAQCLERKSQNIDLAFIFHKLHCFNEMIYNEYLNNNSFEYKKSFYDEIFKFIKLNKNAISKKHSNIFFIYNILLLWKTNDKKYIGILLKNLDEMGKKLEKVILSYYYYYFLTYISSRINKGENEFRKVAMEIFRKMSDKDLFLTDNVITHSDFNSVVNIALPLKEYTWLHSFIIKYKNNIESGFAKDAYNLSLAKFYFHKKMFNEVFPYLNDVEYKSPDYYLNSKFMLARLYFDMGKMGSIDYVVSNLRQYLRKTKQLTEDQILTVKTFNKYIMKLVKVAETNSSSKSDVIVLRKELENETKTVSNKNWFFEKLEEFGKSKK